MDKSRRVLGALGEELAARFLELQGLIVLERDLRCAEVQIDLLAREQACLVVVEVKLRGHPLLAATSALRPRQGMRLRRAARALFARHRWAETVRIDIVGIDWRVAEGRLCLQHLRGVLADQ